MKPEHDMLCNESGKFAGQNVHRDALRIEQCNQSLIMNHKHSHVEGVLDCSLSGVCLHTTEYMHL